MIFLNVPFAEKDEVKTLGARWDAEYQSWFIPRGLSAEKIQALSRWIPAVQKIVGEDRSFMGNRLFVDPVPESCWFKNIRSEVTKEYWDDIRRIVYRRARHKCEICGAGRDAKEGRYIEAHERWSYDDKSGIQKIMRLVALCSDCHLVTHFGFARINGLEEKAFTHLMNVTGMTATQADEHIEEAFELWKKRSKREWKLDLSILTDSGIHLMNKAPQG